MPRVVLIAALLAGASARSDGRYTLREGDTLEAVAAHYYGARWKAVYLSAANGLSTSGAKPGRTLTLPAAWLYRVRRGDTLALLAKRHLGDARRYKALLVANGLTEQSALEVGQELIVPFQVRHTVQASESLSSIARLYYRDASRAALLQEHNALQQGAVEPGAVLVVPVFDRDTLAVSQKPPPRAPDAPGPAPVKTADAALARASVPQVSDAPPAVAASDAPRPGETGGSAAPGAPAAGQPATAPPEAGATAADPAATGAPAPGPPSPVVATGPAPPSDSPTAGARNNDASSQLQRLIERYRRGAFEEACGGLERLLDELTLPRRDRGQLIRYLGYCAVASGDRAAARQYFRQWIDMEPHAQLDPIRTSPKILAIFQAALEEARLGLEDGLPRPSAP